MSSLFIPPIFTHIFTFSLQKIKTHLLHINSKPFPIPKYQSPITMAGGRFRKLLKKYGKVALIVHCSVSAASVSGLYIAINNNVDVESVLQKIRIGNYSLTGPGPSKESNLEMIGEGDEPKSNRTAELVASSGGAFVLAVLCNKALFPVRVPITIALTPPIARFFARRKIL